MDRTSLSNDANLVANDWANTQIADAGDSNTVHGNVKG